MKKQKMEFNIGPVYMKVEYLDLPSFENENFYKVDSLGDNTIIHRPYNILQEIVLEDYIEYSLGFFEKENYKDYVPVFTWASENGEDPIFG